MNGMFDPRVLQYLQKQKEEQQAPQQPPFGGMGEVPPLQEPMQPRMPTTDPFAGMGGQQLPEVQPPQMSQQPPPQLPPDISPAIPGKSLLEGVLGTPQPQEVVPPTVPSQIPPQAPPAAQPVEIPPQRPVPYKQGMLSQQAPQPPADKLREYLEQLRGSDAQLEAAQQQAAEGRRNAGIMDGVEQLARAIGRQPQNPNAYRAEAEAADQPVRDLLMQQKLGQDKLNQYLKLKQLESAGKPSEYQKALLAQGRERIDVSKENQQLNRALRADTAKARQEETAKSRDLRLKNAYAGFGDKLENNHLVKELGKQGLGFQSANELLDLSNKGNTIAFSSLGTKMARAMGEVGVLTEQDVKRYVQSGKLTQSAADRLLKWKGGVPSEASRAEIAEINSALQEQFSAEFEPIIKRYAHRMSVNYDIPLDEAMKRLGAEYFPSGKEYATPKTKTKLSTPSNDDIDKMSEAELKKYLGQ